MISICATDVTNSSLFLTLSYPLSTVFVLCLSPPHFGMHRKEGLTLENVSIIDHMIDVSG